ncbi:hypothetical protein ACN47E_001699 [Coniothyrium glycines]
MESFYDPSNGTVEAHIDDAAFTLLNLDLPSWYISTQLKVTFASRSAFNSVVSSAPPRVAPGLASVLSSKTPPSLDVFRGLPQPSGPKKWAVYALTLEHPELPPSRIGPMFTTYATRSSLRPSRGITSRRFTTR